MEPSQTVEDSTHSDGVHEPQCCLTYPEEPSSPPVEALQQLMTAALVQEIREEHNSHLTYETIVVRILKRLSEAFGLPWNQIVETTRHVYLPRTLHALLERMWRERTKTVTLEEQHCIERILGRDYVRATDLVKLAGCVHKFANDDKDVWILFAVDGLLGEDPKRYVDALRSDDDAKAKHVQKVRQWYREERVRHPVEMKEILEDVFQGTDSTWRQEYVEAVGGTEAVKQMAEWVERSKKKKAEGETSRKRPKATAAAVAETVAENE